MLFSKASYIRLTGSLAGSIPEANQMFVLLMMLMVSMAVLRNYLLMALSNLGELSEKKDSYMYGTKAIVIVGAASILEVTSTVLAGFAQGSTLP